MRRLYDFVTAMILLCIIIFLFTLHPADAAIQWSA